jgi:hypothetical protein
MPFKQSKRDPAIGITMIAELSRTITELKIRSKCNWQLAMLLKYIAKVLASAQEALIMRQTCQDSLLATEIMCAGYMAKQLLGLFGGGAGIAPSNNFSGAFRKVARYPAVKPTW